jgi:hypothetical protein
MSGDYAKTLLEALKLAPRYLVSLSVIAAFFLFGSGKWLKGLGVDEFAKHYRQWIALTFIITSTLFAADRCIAICGWIRYKVLVGKFTKRRLERLHSLTEDEKQILRFYISQQTKTNVLRYDDGVVQGLESAGVIRRSSTLGTLMEGFAYNITDFAWNYLNEHHELLLGTTNTYRTDKRPDFPGLFPGLF